MDKIFNLLGGRKMLVWVISFGTGLGLALAGKLTADASDFIIQMTAVITAGNVGSKIANAMAERFSKTSREE